MVLIGLSTLPLPKPIPGMELRATFPIKQSVSFLGQNRKGWLSKKSEYEKSLDPERGNQPLKTKHSLKPSFFEEEEEGEAFSPFINFG